MHEGSSIGSSSIGPLVAAALTRREPLRTTLAKENTDAWRVFHGTVEGRPGLTVDVYGPVLLVQTWREPLGPGELDAIAAEVEAALGPRQVAWVHRDTGAILERGGGPPDATSAGWCHEGGLRFEVDVTARGQDPLLFLDLRAARRRVRALAAGRSVLNLFAYTCGVGVVAAAAGAAEVWNVDFAHSALQVGERNAVANGIAPTWGAGDGGFRLVEEDVFPVVRQLAGLPVRGRAARRRSFLRLQPRAFDFVVLDPPRWATSPFGAVDLVRDYPSLFKPALLATRPGGLLLATNNVASVNLEDWLDVIDRAATKAGRPLAGVELLPVDEDYPSPDDRAPLKVALLEVPGG